MRPMQQVATEVRLYYYHTIELNEWNYRLLGES